MFIWKRMKSFSDGFQKRLYRHLLRRCLIGYLAKDVELEAIEVEASSGVATIRNLELDINAFNELFNTSGVILMSAQVDEVRLKASLNSVVNPGDPSSGLELIIKGLSADIVFDESFSNMDLNSAGSPASPPRVSTEKLAEEEEVVGLASVSRYMNQIIENLNLHIKDIDIRFWPTRVVESEGTYLLLRSDEGLSIQFPSQSGTGLEQTTSSDDNESILDSEEENDEHNEAGELKNLCRKIQLHDMAIHLVMGDQNGSVSVLTTPNPDVSLATMTLVLTEDSINGSHIDVDIEIGQLVSEMTWDDIENVYISINDITRNRCSNCIREQEAPSSKREDKQSIQIHNSSLSVTQHREDDITPEDKSLLDSLVESTPATSRQSPTGLLKRFADVAQAYWYGDDSDEADYACSSSPTVEAGPRDNGGSMFLRPGYNLQPTKKSVRFSAESDVGVAETSRYVYSGLDDLHGGSESGQHSASSEDSNVWASACELGVSQSLHECRDYYKHRQSTVHNAASQSRTRPPLQSLAQSTRAYGMAASANEIFESCLSVAPEKNFNSNITINCTIESWSVCISKKGRGTSDSIQLLACDSVLVYRQTKRNMSLDFTLGYFSGHFGDEALVECGEAIKPDVWTVGDPHFVLSMTKHLGSSANIAPILSLELAPFRICLPIKLIFELTEVCQQVQRHRKQSHSTGITSEDFPTGIPYVIYATCPSFVVSVMAEDGEAERELNEVKVEVEEFRMWSSEKKSSFSKWLRSLTLDCACCEVKALPPYDSESNCLCILSLSSTTAAQWPKKVESTIRPHVVFQEEPFQWHQDNVLDRLYRFDDIKASLEERTASQVCLSNLGKVASADLSYLDIDRLLNFAKVVVKSVHVSSNLDNTSSGMLLSVCIEELKVSVEIDSSEQSIEKAQVYLLSTGLQLATTQEQEKIRYHLDTHSFALTERFNKGGDEEEYQCYLHSFRIEQESPDEVRKIDLNSFLHPGHDNKSFTSKHRYNDALKTGAIAPCSNVAEPSLSVVATSAYTNKELDLHVAFVQTIVRKLDDWDWINRLIHAFSKSSESNEEGNDEEEKHETSSIGSVTVSLKDTLGLFNSERILSVSREEWKEKMLSICVLVQNGMYTYKSQCSNKEQTNFLDYVYGAHSINVHDFMVYVKSGSQDLFHDIARRIEECHSKGGIAHDSLVQSLLAVCVDSLYDMSRTNSGDQACPRATMDLVGLLEAAAYLRIIETDHFGVGIQMNTLNSNQDSQKNVSEWLYRTLDNIASSQLSVSLGNVRMGIGADTAAALIALAVKAASNDGNDSDDMENTSLSGSSPSGKTDKSPVKESSSAPLDACLKRDFFEAKERSATIETEDSDQSMEEVEIIESQEGETQEEFTVRWLDNAADIDEIIDTSAESYTATLEEISRSITLNFSTKDLWEWCENSWNQKHAYALDKTNELRIGLPTFKKVSLHLASHTTTECSNVHVPVVRPSDSQARLQKFSKLFDLSKDSFGSMCDLLPWIPPPIPLGCCDAASGNVTRFLPPPVHPVFEYQKFDTSSTKLRLQWADNSTRLTLPLQVLEQSHLSLTEEGCSAVVHESSDGRQSLHVKAKESNDAGTEFRFMPTFPYDEGVVYRAPLLRGCDGWLADVDAVKLKKSESFDDSLLLNAGVRQTISLKVQTISIKVFTCLDFPLKSHGKSKERKSNSFEEQQTSLIESFYTGPASPKSSLLRSFRKMACALELNLNSVTARVTDWRPELRKTTSSQSWLRKGLSKAEAMKYLKGAWLSETYVLDVDAVTCSMYGGCIQSQSTLQQRPSSIWSRGTQRNKLELFYLRSGESTPCRVRFDVLKSYVPDERDQRLFVLPQHSFRMDLPSSNICLDGNALEAIEGLMYLGSLSTLMNLGNGDSTLPVRGSYASAEYYLHLILRKIMGKEVSRSGVVIRRRSSSQSSASSLSEDDGDAVSEFSSHEKKLWKALGIKFADTKDVWTVRSFSITSWTVHVTYLPAQPMLSRSNVSPLLKCLNMFPVRDVSVSFQGAFAPSLPLFISRPSEQLGVEFSPTNCSVNSQKLNGIGYNVSIGKAFKTAVEMYAKQLLKKQFQNFLYNVDSPFLPLHSLSKIGSKAANVVFLPWEAHRSGAKSSSSTSLAANSLAMLAKAITVEILRHSSRASGYAKDALKRASDTSQKKKSGSFKGFLNKVRHQAAAATSSQQDARSTRAEADSSDQGTLVAVSLSGRSRSAMEAIPLAVLRPMAGAVNSLHEALSLLSRFFETDNDD